MNISIFGLGYVGCVSLGCLAKNGHSVIGVDVNKTKVDLVNKGKTTIIEKEIDEIILKQYKSGNISATCDASYAVKNTEISFICVGTPSTPNGHLDIEAIYRVSKDIGKAIKGKTDFHIIVIRSTVLPGTNAKVANIVEQASGKSINKDFTIVSNPEFLREGSAVKDYYNPSYTLVGTSHDYAITRMKKVYEDVNAPFIVTNIECAEMIKYVNNAFHALKITFANEVGNICKTLAIDSHKVMNLFSMDTRLNLSPYYLKPGFAYGGSCLPKDLRALIMMAHDSYTDCPVLESIERSNDLQKSRVIKQVMSFGKQKLGFLGLTFKAGTDDLRNSPIIDVIEVLLGKGFTIKIYDKNVRLSKLLGANREYILRKIPYISKFIINDPSEIIRHSDIIIVVNNEEEFKQILENAPRSKIIYDLVNINFTGKENYKNYSGIAW